MDGKQFIKKIQKLDYVFEYDDYHYNICYKIGFCSVGYEADLVEQSNYRFMMRDYQKICANVHNQLAIVKDWVLEHPHFDYEELYSIIEGLESYPCIDDDLYQELHTEAHEIFWIDNASDFFAACINHFCEGYDSQYLEDKNDEIQTKDDKFNDELNDLFNELCEENNEYPYEEYGSIIADFEKIVHGITFERFYGVPIIPLEIISNLNIIDIKVACDPALVANKQEFYAELDTLPIRHPLTENYILQELNPIEGTKHIFQIKIKIIDHRQIELEF